MYGVLYLYCVCAIAFCGRVGSSYVRPPVSLVPAHPTSEARSLPMKFFEDGVWTPSTPCTSLFPSLTIEFMFIRLYIHNTIARLFLCLLLSPLYVDLGSASHSPVPRPPVVD